jgi:hypothetical protein
MVARKQITLIERPPSERFKGRRAPVVRYDDELADYIVEQIAMGRSLLSVCDEPHMPAAAAITYWCLVDLCGFRQKYKTACDIRAQLMAEELLDIIDDSRNDWITRVDKDGNERQVYNPENVARSTLRFTGRRWIISKLLPGVYGESMQLKHADADGGKLKSPPLIVLQPVTAKSEIN